LRSGVGGWGWVVVLIGKIVQKLYHKRSPIRHLEKKSGPLKLLFNKKWLRENSLEIFDEKENKKKSSEPLLF